MTGAAVDLQEGFEEQGFLSIGITNGVPHLRTENSDWFKLADDTNAALMHIAAVAMKAVRTTNWTREAVAVRLLLRSCGTLQGVILLTERGMVAEGRTLARSLLENSFCVAALVKDPEAFLKMLREDADASRRNQGKFIIAQKLGDTKVDRVTLQRAIDDIDARAAIMSPKKVASLGPLLMQYLSYQRLSDDAAHLSARSLDRHAHRNVDCSGWCYRWLPGDQGENAATLHHAILPTLLIGAAITQLLNHAEGHGTFTSLADRFQSMPQVPLV